MCTEYWRKLPNLTAFLRIFLYLRNSITPLYIFSSNIIYFDRKEPIKGANLWDFQVLGSKFVKFLMPILKQQVNSSWNFASFFIVTTQNSPVNFKVIRFLIWIKESNESPNFETFECSGENFPNSPCHFWKHKSVFTQNLHQYSLPSKITPLYFFYLKHYILWPKTVH